jgi:hypothetical protein
VETGGRDLALSLEKTGYEPYLPKVTAPPPASTGRPSLGDDPFADPFA